MAKRVVKAALWQYRDSKGARRFAYFGQEVDLTKAEIERGEAQGVFDPAPVPEVHSVLVERALVDNVARTPEPVLAGVETLPPPPHDVTRPVELPVPTPPAVLAPIEQTAVGGAQPSILLPENVVEQPTESPTKRPANAANIDIWRTYVRSVRTDLPAEQVDTMTKDELKAVVPKDS